MPLRGASGGAGLHRCGDNIHEPLLGRAVGRLGGGGLRGRGHEPDRMVSFVRRVIARHTLSVVSSELTAYHHPTPIQDRRVRCTTVPGQWGRSGLS